MIEGSKTDHAEFSLAGTTTTHHVMFLRFFFSNLTKSGPRAVFVLPMDICTNTASQPQHLWYAHFEIACWKLTTNQVPKQNLSAIQAFGDLVGLIWSVKAPYACFWVVVDHASTQITGILMCLGYRATTQYGRFHGDARLPPAKLRGDAVRMRGLDWARTVPTMCVIYLFVRFLRSMHTYFQMFAAEYVVYLQAFSRFSRGDSSLLLRLTR